MSKILSNQEKTDLIAILKARFDTNTNRHPDISWNSVVEKLENNLEKLWSINQMEISGGEPDVVDFNNETNEFTFIDCSKESPIGRRSFCYDKQALDSRKANKPENNAMDFAQLMGISIMTEEQYRKYHPLILFDSKTSSWVLTPDEVRNLGGAIFCDYRFGKVFTYHNGAESYYAARGFRGIILL